MSDIYKTLSKLLNDLKPHELTDAQAEAIREGIEKLEEPIATLKRNIEDLEVKKQVIEEQIESVEDDLYDLEEVQHCAEGLLDLWLTHKGL